ncbi:MAG: quinone-dependent dihydroorotate dehydrogenase [Pirellulaceae bacterium]
MIWRFLVRPILFSLPAESVHYASMSLFNATMFPPFSSLMRAITRVNDPRLAHDVFGIPFENPVGLAAGFDKQASWFNALSKLGFSHIEVGTITGESQPGNPEPRLFRLPLDRALINRMGFNNVGADHAAAALARSRIRPVLGINIGKTKVVETGHAVEDYVKSFRLLFPFARYFTVNVSSPNTPGLRSLQDREPLLELLQELVRQNSELAGDHDTQPRPILLKIAPDLNDDQLADIADIARQTSLDGIIATNTTISREGLTTESGKVEAIGAGGLSGAPLTQVSRNIVRRIYQLTEGSIPVIGAGGIMSGEDAWQMIRSGASLVQVYTGFVYGGPMFVKRINRYLSRQLDESSFGSIRDVVGVDAGLSHAAAADSRLSAAQDS